MLELANEPRLKDFQQYVEEMEDERGFAQQSARDKCLLLGEEVGELFKAVRKAQGLKMDPESEVGELKGELADILIYLCSIANRFDIDLEQAFLNKEEKNKQRVWK
ncbi:pyrophosphohydrolase [Sansalvadorimonas sp. 2012CJ34-2]|uniref:Pyrophosphohydrolase n=1 Tax=Parendozoicomonas callyspongiae TaxID=2942213 RepID=A0ABT0PFX2_9GAMM|nr:MazG nucleotide pyrophosphohydrolase domain-containing protein [Sansalvadorimonas sp. 2012CJ34-2]MCL6270282.1 pyrophosphohydrolase [Sansalvadorimonas sp. 2012CJ34-2]